MPRRRCYLSGIWDDEWALIEPLLPPPACESRTGGRPEKRPRPAIVDAIRDVVDTGCKWRALPRDFPPWPTCYGIMARWAAVGVVGQIRDELRERLESPAVFGHTSGVRVLVGAHGSSTCRQHLIGPGGGLVTTLRFWRGMWPRMSRTACQLRLRGRSRYRGLAHEGGPA